MPLEVERQPFFLWLIRDSISSKLILILIKKCGKRQFCRRRYSSCASRVSLLSSRVAFRSWKIGGTCVEWIFLLPSTSTTTTTLLPCLWRRSHNPCSWRSLAIRVLSKQTFCGSESSLLYKKFQLFTNKKTFQMDTSGPVMPFFGLVKY